MADPDPVRDVTCQAHGILPHDGRSALLPASHGREG
jgi:hypothetical protein